MSNIFAFLGKVALYSSLWLLTPMAQAIQVDELSTLKTDIQTIVDSVNGDTNSKQSLKAFLEEGDETLIHTAIQFLPQLRSNRELYPRLTKIWLNLVQDKSLPEMTRELAAGQLILIAERTPALRANIIKQLTPLRTELPHLDFDLQQMPARIGNANQRKQRFLEIEQQLGEYEEADIFKIQKVIDLNRSTEAEIKEAFRRRLDAAINLLETKQDLKFARDFMCPISIFCRSVPASMKSLLAQEIFELEMETRSQYLDELKRLRNDPKEWQLGGRVVSRVEENSSMWVFYEGQWYFYIFSGFSLGLKAGSAKSESIDFFADSDLLPLISVNDLSSEEKCLKALRVTQQVVIDLLKEKDARSFFQVAIDPIGLAEMGLEGSANASVDFLVETFLANPSLLDRRFKDLQLKIDSQLAKEPQWAVDHRVAYFPDAASQREKGNGDIWIFYEGRWRLRIR